MSAQENEQFIQPWRQANTFAITLRGHWAAIPNPDVQYSSIDSSKDDSISNPAKNLNSVYDSFYSPVDFKIKGLSVKCPDPIPLGGQIIIKIKVNGSVIEKFPIKENEYHNIKRFSLDCDYIIYEDDYIEVTVEFSDYSKLSWNGNNIIVGISGCTSYKYYKEIWSTDENTKALVTTTEEIDLSGLQTIDGVELSDGDVVLVKNQTITEEDGLWVAAEGDWTRSSEYPSVESLIDVSVYVESGNTGNSDSTFLYTAIIEDESASIPEYIIGYTLIEWNEGDDYYKTNMLLENKSGYVDITTNVELDSLRSPINMLVQGVHISIFEDYLMSIESRYNIPLSCFFFDILVNYKSILPYLDIPRPIQVDPSVTFQNYDLTEYTRSVGYPIVIGDDVQIRIYNKNGTARHNGKKIQVLLYGCAPDCAALDSPLVSIYEPCEAAPCDWKFAIVDKCEPVPPVAASSISGLSNSETTIDNSDPIISSINTLGIV